MRELEGPLKITPDTQLVEKWQKEYTLKASMQKKRGLILFAVDLYKQEAKAVKITSSIAIGFYGEVVKSNKAQYDPNAIYVWAINKYNALRKVNKEYDTFIQKELSKKK